MRALERQAEHPHRWEGLPSRFLLFSTVLRPVAVEPMEKMGPSVAVDWGSDPTVVEQADLAEMFEEELVRYDWPDVSLTLLEAAESVLGTGCLA